MNIKMGILKYLIPMCMKRFYLVLLFVNLKALFSRNVSQIPKVCSAFDVTQNAEHISLLYVGIYEPYGNADEDTKGVALHRMGCRPVNLTQIKLLLSFGRHREIGGDWHHLCVNEYQSREGLQL